MSSCRSNFSSVPLLTLHYLRVLTQIFLRRLPLPSLLVLVARLAFDGPAMAAGVVSLVVSSLVSILGYKQKPESTWRTNQLVFAHLGHGSSVRLLRRNDLRAKDSIVGIKFASARRKGVIGISAIST